MKLDDNYTLTSEKECWVLKYEKETERINKRTGQKEVSSDVWYPATLQQALRRYTDQKLKECDSVSELVLEINRLQEIINKVNNK